MLCNLKYERENCNLPITKGYSNYLGHNHGAVFVGLAEDTLLSLFLCVAIAEVYNNEGDSEYSQGEYNSALHQYTEGLNVKCMDDTLNATLFTNRASVHYHLGENLLFGLIGC